MGKLKILLVTFLMILSNIAFADLLIEPVVGYSFGKFESATPTPTESKSAHGPGFGGRLGYQNLGIQLGVDYLKSTINVEDADKDLSLSEIGGFVGFKFPILFRVYAGYTFSGTGKLDTIDYTKGTGAKMGLGFTGLPFININLEYRTLTFAEYKTGGSVTKEDSKFNAMFLGLSLPFTI